MQIKCILKLYVQGDFLFLNRGDRDRSQRQARWEMRHNVQQYCVCFFFLGSLGFLIFTCTKASSRKMFKHTWYITSVSSCNSRCGQSRRGEEGTVFHHVTLKHLKTWELAEIFFYLGSQFKNLDCETFISPVSRNHITSLGRECELQESCSQGEIFFRV